MNIVNPPAYFESDNETTGAAVSIEDFFADMKSRHYLFVPARELWPASSVDARLPPVPVVDSKGNPFSIAPT
jgi:hypothetical protein